MLSPRCSRGSRRVNDVSLTTLIALHRLAPSFSLHELEGLVPQPGPARLAYEHVQRCRRYVAPAALGPCRKGARLARVLAAARWTLDGERCAAWNPVRGQWQRCPRPPVTRRKGRPACRRHARSRVMLLRPPKLAPRLMGSQRPRNGD
jgi:hypothetical protein